MLKGTHDLSIYIDTDQTSEDQRNHPHKHGHAAIQHQHSAPTGESFRGRGSENGSFNSRDSYPIEGDTPRTAGSLADAKHRRSSQESTAARVPGSSALHEVAALRKHIKFLEERLRNERHTHAVKFSEVERQLIQENAKLKVSTSALQRQVRREQQLIQDHEAELSKLKREKKNRFTLSGITRSFSDVRLEDMEMKESSLKRKNTDSEVVRLIKERLDDSEKDRVEAEALFSQRISILLRERNIQRADMGIAEEAVAKLSCQNEALQKDMDDLRIQLRDMLEKSYQDESLQLALLKRANSQLQEELNHFHRERGKLVSELETISEELSLVKANERQNSIMGPVTGEMKNKIDSLRVKLSSLERKQIQDVDFRNGAESDSEGSARSGNGPSTSAGRPTSSATSTQVIAQLHTELGQKSRDLVEVRTKLENILELSQRYEKHCYNLEKELFKVYGAKYQFRETSWRKTDSNLLKSVRKVVTSQTYPRPAANSPIPAVLTTTATIQSVPSQAKLARFFAATQTNFPLPASTSIVSASDHVKLAEAKMELQAAHRALHVWQEKYRLLEMQLHDLSEDDGVYDEPITQAEIDAKIREARQRVADAETGGVVPRVPKLASSNPFAAIEGHEVNYTAPSSGIWTSWSSGSSQAVDQPRLASEY